MVLVVIILFLLLLCAVFAGKQKNKLGRAIKELILVATVCVACNVAYVLSKDEATATLFFGAFSALVGWMLAYLHNYVYLYTRNRKPRVRRIGIIHSLVLIDTVSFVLNNFFHHLFTFKGVVNKGKFTIHIVDNHSLFFQLHLAICYIMVLEVVYLLVNKIFTTFKC